MKYTIHIPYILLSACLWLFIHALPAQQDFSNPPPAGPAPEIRIGDAQEFSLDNGLKVFLVENNKLPRISFSLSLNHDPVQEGPDAGTIEALGELLRTGTATQSKDQIDEAVDFMGAALYTSGSTIYASSLKKHTPKLLQLVSEILYKPAMKQEELDKIRKNAVSALKLAQENPDAIAGRVSDALVYGQGSSLWRIRYARKLVARRCGQMRQAF